MLKLASKIVSAYSRANPLPVAQVPTLLSQIVAALEQTTAPVEAVPELSSAVPVKKSVRPDCLICLECGSQQKTLKRHLHSAHDLTPDEYRARWGLGRDYPMVAPDYAERRSQLAKDSGLGRKPKEVEGESQPAAPATGRKPGFQYPASRWAKPSK